MSRLLPVATILLVFAGPVYGQASRPAMAAVPAWPRSPGRAERPSRLAVPLSIQTIARLPAGWTRGLVPAGYAPARPAPARRAAVSRVRAVLHTVIGAIVGAGAGYFASQMVSSDWDGDATAADRIPWAVGGAVLGGIGGGLLATRAPLTGKAQPVASPSPMYEVLTREDLAQSSARNAYEAIRSLRPRWLRGRGASSSSEMAFGVVVPVYFGSSRLGTQAQLRDILISTVVEIRYYDAGQATARWGSGHNNGAIQIITAGNR